MKRLILLFTSLMIATALNTALADPTPIPLTQDPIEKPDEDYRGQRMPAAPIMVVVDVEAGTITGASPLLDGIVRYEIWDADGNLCIASAPDFATALKAINGCHGTYLLRLCGDSYALAGSITL